MRCRAQFWILRQHRTIPALRLQHRSGSCGTASALPKCSIMSGCGTRIVLRGQNPLALCDRCPCFGSLFPPLVALTFAASSIICAFGLASAAPRSPYRHAVSALRIMRYCLNKEYFWWIAARGAAQNIRVIHTQKTPPGGHESSSCGPAAVLFWRIIFSFCGGYAPLGWPRFRSGCFLSLRYPVERPAHVLPCQYVLPVRQHLHCQHDKPVPFSYSISKTYRCFLQVIS